MKLRPTPPDIRRLEIAHGVAVCQEEISDLNHQHASKLQRIVDRIRAYQAECPHEWDDGRCKWCETHLEDLTIYEKNPT